MLTGRRFRVEFTDEQGEYAEQIGAVCRAVGNTGLEQRREYRRRGAWMNYRPQVHELAEAKGEHPWLNDVRGALFAADVDGLGQGLPRACDVSGAVAFWASLGAVVPVPRGRQDGRGEAQRSPRSGEAAQVGLGQVRADTQLGWRNHLLGDAHARGAALVGLAAGRPRERRAVRSWWTGGWGGCGSWGAGGGGHQCRRID